MIFDYLTALCIVCASIDNNADTAHTCTCTLIGLDFGTFRFTDGQINSILPYQQFATLCLGVLFRRNMRSMCGMLLGREQWVSASSAP